MPQAPGTAASPSRAQLVASFASDVLFGIAAGLLGYYALTGIVATHEQRALRDDSPPALYAEQVVEGPRLDFEGWEREDARYWRSLAPGKVFGRLVIERIKMDELVVKGVRPADLKRGPGWIDYTNFPGPRGTVGISGHRTTYGAPFRRLDRLRKGDTITFYSPYRRYTYRVERSFAVTPDRVEVVADVAEPRLVLTACHPPYSARLRLIVQASLVAVERLAPKADR